MTDQEPTQEELVKFWKWCGFIITERWVTSPDSLVVSKVYPALTLDNLFKYAVPKLFEVLGKPERWGIVFRVDCNLVRVQVYGIDIVESFEGRDKLPELALFRAIQEAVK